MTDQALEEVDWDSHTMAVGRSQLSQPFLVKMLHQILPVGMLIHRYDPVKYTIDCPPVVNTVRRMIIFFSVTIPVVWDGKLNLKLH
jgi:hypothetical protein